MFRFFGENNLDLITKVLNRIIVDVPIIELFGYDVKIFEGKLKQLTSTKEMNLLFENENQKIDGLLESFSNYRDLFDKKSSFVYNNNLDTDYLDEHGFESWGEYYTTDIKDSTLKKIIEHLIHRTNEDSDAAMNIASRLIPKECEYYKNKITQCYLISKSKFVEKTPAELTSTEKISIIGKKIDVVRIFEAMRKAKITSDKQGEIKKYGNIFTDENFVDNYYAERRRLERDQSSSNSKEIIDFIKILCETSIKDKNPEIEQIINHLEKLQK